MYKNSDEQKLNNSTQSIDFWLAIRRLAAVGIDLFISTAGMVLVALPLISWKESLAAPALSFGFLFIPVYLLFRDGFHGAGVGKRLMQVRAIDVRTGKPISYKQAFLHQLLSLHRRYITVVRKKDLHL